MNKEDFKKRADAFKPKIVSTNKNWNRRRVVEKDLPEGMTLGIPPRKGTFNTYTTDNIGGSGQVLNHIQRPYLPEFETQDRIQYPTSRQEANKYWRMFHKYDPIFGTAIDMYCEMLTSDFSIEVEETKDKEISNTIEYMCEKVQFIERFKQMVKEYLICGESIVHNFFDETLGIWSYIALHDPDYIDVKDSPIIDIEPMLSFIPDDNLVNLISDRSPESLELRNRMPSEFVARILAKQPIRLKSSNCSFIPRKLSPYDIRGTSLASRLWRIWMVEDAVYNSTIATYRRHSSPIKVIKLGDSATGWIPDPETEGELLAMLNRCEIDPQCFVPETLITRSSGVQTPIGELEVGDDLLDKDGNICIVEVLEREFTEEIVELDIIGTPLIKCTPNHKWPVWGGPRTCSCGCGTPIRRGNFEIDHGCNPNGYKYQEKHSNEPKRLYGVKVRFLEEFNPYQKLKASEIRPGDYLMIPRKFEEVKPGGVTKDMARLLGYYTAERCTIEVYKRDDNSIRTGVEFSFSSMGNDDKFIKDIKGIFEDVIGEKVEIVPTKRNAVLVRSRRNATTEIAYWLEKNSGKYARNKKLSAEVMKWPLDLKYEFIKGYFAGDGGSVLAKSKSNNESRYIEITSASKNLLNQIKLILAQLGTYASFNARKQVEGSFASGNDIFRLHIYGNFALKLSKEIWGFDIKNKNTNKKPINWWLDDEYIYVKVRSVKTTELDEPQQVVNMTVSGDHSYLTNCIGTRNSWLVYHYGIQFEAWGTTDRAISIKGEHDTIEKIKLLALGLSKSFMTGDVSFACQFEDAKIRMNDGSYNNICDIKIGNEVVDIYGNEKRVIDLLKYKSPDEMVKITIYGNRTFYFTENHELPVFSRPHKCLCGCGEDLGDKKISSNGYKIWRSFSTHHHKHDGKSGRDRKYIEYGNKERIVAKFPEEYNPYRRLQAKDVRIGDWLTIPRKFKVSDTEVNKDNLAKARLLGYYVAEGSITESENTINKNMYTRFSFGRIDSDKETQYVGDVKELLNTLNCEPSSRDITLWLYENGYRYSNHKVLSSEVMHWNLRLKEELIKGMFRGNGYLYIKDKRSESMNRTKLIVRYTTTSKNLTTQLELILAQLGYACLITECKERTDKHGGKHNKLWFIDINGKHAYPLAKMIWGDIPSVWNKHDFSNLHKEQHQGENTQVIIDEEYIYLPVTCMEVIKTNKEEHPYVYSLTVDDSHSYTTNNISSFNSAKSGLQVFLRRLLSLRQFFESIWIYPKFIRPISIANDWIKSSEKEINHNYRIKRTAQEIEEQNLLIVPKIKWKNKLDPGIDSDTMQAYLQLERLGFKISRSSVGAVVNLDWKTEIKKSAEEWLEEKKILERTLGDTKVKEYEEEQGVKKPSGPPSSGPGAGTKPPSAKPTSKPSVSAPPGSGEAGEPEEKIETPSEGDMSTGVE